MSLLLPDVNTERALQVAGSMGVVGSEPFALPRNHRRKQRRIGKRDFLLLAHTNTRAAGRAKLSLFLNCLFLES